MAPQKINFSALTKGIRATKAIEFPYAGQVLELYVRPLLGGEEGDALAWGRAYAVEKGIKEPREGDALYEIGVMAATVAAGCVLGPDDPDGLFFDGGPEQVLKFLDRDRIAYLYEAQQYWQDECSPRVSRVDGQDYIAYVLACAGAAEGADPLAMLRPVTRASFVRTLASQHLASLELRSRSGSDESNDASKPKSEPENPAWPSVPTKSSA